LTVWKELELVGERLRFRRLSGTGPDEGQSEKIPRVLKHCFVEQVNVADVRWRFSVLET